MATDFVDYYSDLTFWNAFDAVQQYQNRLATAEPATFWYHHLRREHGSFNRALILNCGNGWVERELVRIGLVREVVGIDISPVSIAEARRLAADAGAAITYQELDINSAPLPAGPFDLVINHAAAHHITRIDRVFRELCRRMSEHGRFVSWDYVGPHRNQYTVDQWHAAWSANQELPARFQQEMRYPYLPGMVEGDPTEAVHSELIIPTTHRYFHVDLYRPLGGAIGYLLITHNRPLYEAPLPEVEPIIKRLIALDEAFVTAHPDQTLFAYIIARPKPEVLDDDESLARWAAEEDEREARAAVNDGAYYPPTMIAAIDSVARAGVLPMHRYPARTLALHLASRIPLVGSLARRARDRIRQRR